MKINRSMHKTLPTDTACDMLIDNFHVFIKNYQKFYESGGLFPAKKSRKALANMIVLSRKIRKEILFDRTFKLKR